MKKISLLILILCLSAITVVAQNQINANGHNVFYYPNGVKSSEGEMVNGKPEGWWKSYNDKGVLVSEGNRKNSQLDSLWIFYNDKGDTTLIIHYKEGKKNGKRIQFFQDEQVVENWLSDSLCSPIRAFSLDGKLKRETPCQDGVPHGIEKEYDTIGHIVKLAHYYHGVLTKREQINRTDHLGNKQGNWKYFWPNGNLKLEGTYLNDKKHGFFKEYDENGDFLFVQKYENDYLVADAEETKRLEQKVSYHKNGKPSIIATYYNNKAEGLRREFDEDGNVIKGYVFSNGMLLCEGITDMEGKRQGKWKEFYETGELKSEGSYKNSNRTGKWKFYFPNKSIEVSGSYSNKGKMDGEWQWFYPNGELMRVAYYTNGTLDGEFHEYDENGVSVTEGVYEDGTEEGHWIYRRGTSIEEGDFYDGMRTGLWKIWYEPDKIAAEIHYDQDLMNGKYTIYYENNVIKRTGKYVNGERDGVWYDYYETGEMFLTTVYKDGKELRWNNYKIEY